MICAEHVAVPSAVLARPMVGSSIVAPVPAYRYIYEPDRIIGIAVQALPR